MIRPQTNRILLLLFLALLWPTPGNARNYQIPIEVSVPVDAAMEPSQTKAYNKLTLGIHPEATESFDPQWDTPAFFTTPDPDSGPLLRAYVSHPEYAGNQQELWRDIRSDGSHEARIDRTWNLAVHLEPSQIGKTVTLSWVLPPALASSNEKVSLLDPDLQTTVDMRTQNRYDYVNSSSQAPRVLIMTVSGAPGSSNKDSSGSGSWGCGVIQSFHEPPPAKPGLSVGLVINLVLLLSPLLARQLLFQTKRA